MALGALNGFVEAFAIYGFDVAGIGLNQAMSARWNSPLFAAGGGIISATGGRTGANPALAISHGSGCGKTMAHNSHWIAGCGFKTNTISAGGGPIFVLSNNNVRLFQLNMNPDGTMTLTGANNTQIIDTTDDPMLFNGQWIFWEVDVTFSGTTNINVLAELKVNNVVVASGNINTGINMANLLSNSATANFFFLGPGTVSAGGSVFDGSFYLHNASGDVPGYWGDIRILKVVPDGDTAQADWTPNSGSVHYDRVHELPKDDDVTYLADGTPGDKDSWDWEDLSPLSGVIRTVQLSVAARKDDEGSKSFRTGVGATLSEAQSSEFFVNDSYIYYHYNWDVDPATGLPWTIADFNAKQFGIEVMS